MHNRHDISASVVSLAQDLKPIYIHSNINDTDQNNTHNSIKKYIICHLNEEVNLQKQIDRLNKINLEAIKEKKRFIEALEALFEELRTDVKRQIDEFSHINVLQPTSHYQTTKANSLLAMIKASAAYELVKDTTELLENINNNLENINTSNSSTNIDLLVKYEKKYTEKCKQTPYSDNCEKAIKAILISGLCFAIGFTAGAVAGAAIGTLFGNPITLAAGGLIGGLVLGVTAAYYGYQFAKDRHKIPDGAFKHFLTFKTPLFSAAEKVAHSGIALQEKEHINKTPQKRI